MGEGNSHEKQFAATLYDVVGRSGNIATAVSKEAAERLAEVSGGTVVPHRDAASVDEPVPTETFGARVQEARRLWGEGDESALIAYLLNVPVEKVLSVRP